MNEGLCYHAFRNITVFTVIIDICKNKLSPLSSSPFNSVIRFVKTLTKSYCGNPKFRTRLRDTEFQGGRPGFRDDDSVYRRKYFPSCKLGLIKIVRQRTGILKPLGYWNKVNKGKRQEKSR